MSIAGKLRRMTETSATVANDGPAVKAGIMDVKDLAPALLALGELCERANLVINGDRATVRVNVRAGFPKGSFSIDVQVVQTLLERGQDLLLNDGVTAALTLVTILGFAKGASITLLGLFKLLMGRRPESTMALANGNIQIQVNISQRIEISSELAKLYNDPWVRSSAARVVAPLEHEGIELFESRAGREVVERVTRDDLASFTAQEPTQQSVACSERETVLQLVKPSFSERLKWVFSNGDFNFSADVEDDAFFGKVQRREHVFGRGDLLRVLLRTETFVNETGQLSNRYTVIRVVDHIEPPRQIPLL